MSQMPENHVNLYRLQIIIIDGGLLVVRNITDQTLAAQGITLSSCLNQERTTITRLRTRGIITQKQYDVLFPTDGEDPTTSEMDFTLIICLLRCLKCFGLKEFNWSTKPISTNLTVEADICRLKYYRHEICHLPTTTGIQPNDFVTWWDDIEQILVRQSSPALNIQQIIANFKACPLDPEEEKRLQEEVKRWKDYEANVDRLNEEIEKRQDAEKSNTVVSSIQTEEEKYQENKKKLQCDLIKFYRKRCSSIPLSLFLEEKETPLAGFYVMPDIVAIKKKSLTSHEEERTPIKSLRDMFSTGSGDQQEIYLSAGAGFGKTAFSKYLAITWCQAHCHDKNYACFKEDELKTLLDFQFLFLVLLRDCTSVCNIDDMIEQQITKNLPSLASLNKVLRREKCLIILDGLDEWTHPDNSCSEVTEKIPHRYTRDNCVILTTTRPWKLGVSNLKTSQINKHLEMVKLSAISTQQLIENAIRKITGVRDERVLKSKTKDLDKVTRDHGLDDMEVIPLLVMYLVTLWCNNFQIGNLKHEIYINFIEFIFMRTSLKHSEVQPSCVSSASEIPEYFKHHKFCIKFYSVIKSLAELAYQTLFNKKRENTLVFDITVAEKYLKAEDMKLSLLSGILSKSTRTTLIQEIIGVSFSHKTIQEFFAVIYVSESCLLEKCRNMEEILAMSDIFVLVSEMMADRMCAISNDLMSVINKDEKTRNYRTGSGVEYLRYNPLYHIQKMIRLCLQEMPESENIQLCLQDFFIDEDTKAVKQFQHLFKQNKNNIKSLYINSSSLHEMTELFSLTDLNHIQTLYYYGDKKKEAKINLILFPSLQNLTLSHGEWTNDEENLSENLAGLQNLQKLHIDRFTFSHKVLETVLNYISNHTSMKELILECLKCKEHDSCHCKGLNLDLSHHSTLTKLHLEQLPRLHSNITTSSLVHDILVGINLDESSLLLSCDMLSIERLELRGRLQNFITVLENLPQTVKEMTAITLEAECERVKENEHMIPEDWKLVFKIRKTSNE